jgi:hypothetical protein
MTDEAPIINQYELADWIYTNVRKRLDNELNRQNIAWVNFEKKVTKKVNDMLEARTHLEHLQSSVGKEIKAVEARTKALQDRDNNLQNIYDKMIQIEKSLEAFEMVKKLMKLKDENS